jgi:hypothetical protein
MCNFDKPRGKRASPACFMDLVTESGKLEPDREWQAYGGCIENLPAAFL